MQMYANLKPYGPYRIAVHRRNNKGYSFLNAAAEAEQETARSPVR